MVTLRFYPKTLGTLSDYHRERFRQKIPLIKRLYNGKWSEGILEDFCWLVRREAPTDNMKRKNYYVTRIIIVLGTDNFSVTFKLYSFIVNIDAIINAFFIVFKQK